MLFIQLLVLSLLNLKIEIMIDTYDTHNPLNPSNQDETAEEILSELQEQQNWNGELCQKIAIAKNDLKKCIELAEQCNNTLLYNQLLKIKL